MQKKYMSKVCVCAAAVLSGLCACSRPDDKKAVELVPQGEEEKDFYVVDSQEEAAEAELAPEAEKPLVYGVSLDKASFLASDNEYAAMYRELLLSDSYMEDYWDDDHIRCSLVPLDEDDIPELFILSGDWHSAPVKIYSADSDGNIVYDGAFLTEFGAIICSPGNSIVRVVDGNHGYYTYVFLYVKDGEVKYLGGATEDGGHLSIINGTGEEITYFIDLVCPQEILDDPSVFGDDSRFLSLMDTENGTITDEAGYEQYIMQFMKGGSLTVKYRE